ncbi:MAG: hypothetical protein CMM49_07225, partial [Rhodospirillaceae bacterium]|nr:hypothetical protein [Rhodospirillaceae bacterium]
MVESLTFGKGEMGDVRPGTPASSAQEYNLVIDASGHSSLTIPFGVLLLKADFVREGTDLLLVGPNGEQILVRDYFTMDPPPDLLTEGGAMLTADTVEALAGPIAPGLFAQAEEGAEASPIGSVESVEGEVTVTRADGTEIKLNEGDPVFQGDVLETGEEGTVGIVFIDDSTFALDEDGRMVLDELIFDPQSTEGKSSLTVVQGAFTFVSGKIAQSGPDSMKVSTPVATLGIRGTKVAGQAAQEGEENTIVLLEGEILVTNQSGVALTLNQPNQSVQVTSAFTPPQAVQLTPDQVQQRFGGVLESLPPSPAATQETQETEGPAATEEAAEEEEEEEEEGE